MLRWWMKQSVCLCVHLRRRWQRTRFTLIPNMSGAQHHQETLSFSPLHRRLSTQRIQPHQHAPYLITVPLTSIFLLFFFFCSFEFALHKLLERCPASLFDSRPSPASPSPPVPLTAGEGGASYVSSRGCGQC